MQVSIKCAPSYSVATAILTYGESLFVERGAMVAMSTGLAVSAGLNASLPRAALRKWLGRESFVMAKYTAAVEDAFVMVAPKFPGDIVVLDNDDQNRWRVETGALLATDAHVEINVRVAGIATALLGEGVSILEAVGDGKLIVCSYGGLMRMELDGDEEFIVDSGHLVAYTEGVSMSAGPLRSLGSAVLSGEGIVATLRGPGVVYIQSRAENGLRSWLLPERWQNDRDM